MKHSDLQKERHANEDVVCSGNRLCHDCMVDRKKNKKSNNKAIRRINKKLTNIDE